jgi:peptidoglycan/LPS O-acetylase OafA/YrhL
MGAVTWIVGGLLALLLARTIRPMRRSWKPELLAALAVALLAGITGTALDFGGWQEPDWRAGTFAFLAGFTAIALMRLALRSRLPVNPPSDEKLRNSSS